MYTGSDESQVANTNSGRVHKQKLREWNERNDGSDVANESSLREAWLLSSVLCGMNANVTAAFADQVFNRTHVLDCGDVPRDGQGVFLYVYVHLLKI